MSKYIELNLIKSEKGHQLINKMKRKPSVPGNSIKVLRQIIKLTHTKGKPLNFKFFTQVKDSNLRIEFEFRHMRYVSIRQHKCLYILKN